MRLTIAMAAVLLLLALPRSAEGATWRDVDPEDLVVMDTAHGRVLFELSPKFAPAHAKRFRDLVRARFYDGKSFYRVIDGFVAQGGIGEGDDKKLAEWPALKAEFDRNVGLDLNFVPLGSPDLFADRVGHVDGFPVGQSVKAKRVWLLHCPGALAMARDSDPDTGATEFYVPIGHATRRLDRNLTVFGRVLSGMMHLQKLNRGDPKVESGVIQDPAKRDAIIRAQVAADMPEAERPVVQVMDPQSKAFAEFKAQRKNPAPDFYRHVAPNLDICSFNAPVRMNGEIKPE